MDFAAYTKAILGCLVLEGLRAGVWTGVQRGADLVVPAANPLPALEDAPPAQSAQPVCEARPVVQWQCPPCPECPSCPSPPLVALSSHSWGPLEAGSAQLAIGLLAATLQYGCSWWGSEEAATGEGSCCW